MTLSALILHIDPLEDDRLLIRRIHRRVAPPSALLQVATVAEARKFMKGGILPALVLAGGSVADTEGLIRELAVPVCALVGDGVAEVEGAQRVLLRQSNVDQLELALTEVFQAFLSQAAGN